MNLLLYIKYIINVIHTCQLYRNYLHHLLDRSHDHLALLSSQTLHQELETIVPKINKLAIIKTKHCFVYKINGSFVTYKSLSLSDVAHMSQIRKEQQWSVLT